MLSCRSLLISRHIVKSASFARLTNHKNRQALADTRKPVLYNVGTLSRDNRHLHTYIPTSIAQSSFRQHSFSKRLLNHQITGHNSLKSPTQLWLQRHHPTRIIHRSLSIKSPRITSILSATDSPTPPQPQPPPPPHRRRRVWVKILQGIAIIIPAFLAYRVFAFYQFFKHQDKVNTEEISAEYQDSLYAIPQQPIGAIKSETFIPILDKIHSNYDMLLEAPERLERHCNGLTQQLSQVAMKIFNVRTNIGDDPTISADNTIYTLLLDILDFCIVLFPICESNIHQVVQEAIPALMSDDEESYEAAVDLLEPLIDKDTSESIFPQWITTLTMKMAYRWCFSYNQSTLAQISKYDHTVERCIVFSQLLTQLDLLIDQLLTYQLQVQKDTYRKLSPTHTIEAIELGDIYSKEQSKYLHKTIKSLSLTVNQIIANNARMKMFDFFHSLDEQLQERIQIYDDLFAEQENDNATKDRESNDVAHIGNYKLDLTTLRDYEREVQIPLDQLKNSLNRDDDEHDI